jgi:site-specific DNA-methyltransferase (adenine-specific)
MEEEAPLRIFHGSREPKVREKWALKKAAWANGCRPTKTFHKLIRGDARTLDDKPEGDLHLVVTSPPYFNLIDYRDSPKEVQLGAIDDYGSFLDELDKVWARCYRRLAPGGRMCVIVGDVCVPRRRDGKHHVIPLHADISVRCRRIGFDYLTPILWAKIANATTEAGGSARFLGKPYEPNGIIKNDVEYILMFRKSGRYRMPTPRQRALSVLDRDEHDAGYRAIWTDIRGQSRKGGHPAPFPVSLAERLIRLFSFVGDTVLDPFVGSGTTTVAAIRSARSSLGYDISNTYLNSALIRAGRIEAPVAAEISFDR